MVDPSHPNPKSVWSSDFDRSDRVMPPPLMLIGGKCVPGEGAAERVVNPATGEVIGSVPEATPDQIEQAVQAAEQAFSRWKRTPVRERTTCLLAMAARIEARIHELARLESYNCGKPYALMLREEMAAIVDVFRYFAGAARALEAPAAAEYVSGHTSFVRRDPIGVVAAIAPWNYPLLMAAWKICPAIAAGNTIVLKPSELTPLSILALIESFAEVFPPGVVNIVYGRGETVGAPLAARPEVRMVSLTGDIVTGQKILEGAARSIKRTHLELGGKAPVIVCADADVEAAIAGIRASGYYNAGQDALLPAAFTHMIQSTSGSWQISQLQWRASESVIHTTTMSRWAPASPRGSASVSQALSSVHARRRTSRLFVEGRHCRAAAFSSAPLS
jgi:aminobutyraldehyde dehydrogenase